MIEIHHGDCLEVLATLPNNSVDAIVTDPPYFKVKAEWWDRQWEKPTEFLAWLDRVAEQWKRVLKPNGSLYCFASPKMAARVEVMLGGRFNVLNHVVWDKDGRSRAAMTCKEQGRSYFPESERIIFCEHYGADNIAKGEAGYGAKCDELRGFVFEPLRAYLDGERTRAGLRLSRINGMFGFAVSGSGWARDTFTRVDGGWNMITAENYAKLQTAFPGYFTRTYEELRQQYEELRRPFNVTADVPYTDVWTFPTVSHYPGKHPCEKPAALLEHIISASTRPGAVVLDCFAGSGSTLVAAKKLGRSGIGVEIDPHWVSFAQNRVGNFDHESLDPDLRLAWLKSQTQPPRSRPSRYAQKIDEAAAIQLSLLA